MKPTVWAAALVLAVVCGALWAVPCQAFNPATRREILNDAMEFAPPEIRAYLDEHRRAVINGMIHDYTTDIKADPRAIAHIYENLVKRLRAGEMDSLNTVRSFGVLACYISEAVAPGPMASSEDLNPEKVRYDGYDEIRNAKAKTKQLIDSYHVYWNDPREAVQMLLYNITVNEIVDFWVSAWLEAGKSIKVLTPKGQEIQSEVIVMTPEEESAAGPGGKGAAKSPAGEVSVNTGAESSQISTEQP